MTGRVDGDPLGLYRDLALRQRGAHNAYLDLGRFAVASASPELFAEVRAGGEVLLRPMKGTARRGRHPAEDERRAQELRASPKERAENLMIVDLLRNDVARVADTGSVQVPGLFTVEHFPTVHQLTSDVTARLRPGIGLLELFTALFPSGSVTGAPKRSSMAVLRELEPTPRGVYCGVVGLVGPPSAPVRLRFSVAIRTAVVDRATGTAVYGTGGGITWGSDAAAEHAELLAKAAVLGGAGGLPEVPELWETLRWDGGMLRNGERHLRRLAASAERLGLPLDPAAARALLAGRLAGAPPSRVRLRLARDGALAVDVGPLPPPPAGPVRLGLDDEPVDDGDLLLFHKTSRREPYDRRRLRRPDVDDVVLVNGRGELTEVTTANLAVRCDGRWWTPPLDSGVLPGVERARLVGLGRLAERVLTAADLAAAEEVAVVNSLRGWRSAVVVDPLC
jgi:para-aminobenzoate synthetase/4-amino-4-deoxychorismate lyase